MPKSTVSTFTYLTYASFTHKIHSTVKNYQQLKNCKLIVIKEYSICHKYLLGLRHRSNLTTGTSMTKAALQIQDRSPQLRPMSHLQFSRASVQQSRAMKLHTLRLSSCTLRLCRKNKASFRIIQ